MVSWSFAQGRPATVAKEARTARDPKGHAQLEELVEEPRFLEREAFKGPKDGLQDPAVVDPFGLLVCESKDPRSLHGVDDGLGMGRAPAVAGERSYLAPNILGDRCSLGPNKLLVQLGGMRAAALPSGRGPESEHAPVLRQSLPAFLPILDRCFAGKASHGSEG